MSLEYVISATDQFSGVFDNFEKKAKSIGDSMTAAGKKLTAGITLPIVGLATAAGLASVDFESAFTGVIKTVDATDEELAKLRTGILDMAKVLPSSAVEIAAVGEAAGQLGIKTENILSFSRTMIDLGQTTNMTADEAATSLARLANITQMPQTEFDKLGSTIVALGNNLATTEGEIVAMGLRLAGAGSTVGLTEAQILGFAGALSSVGIEAEAGGSAISKLMVNIASEVATGGKKLEGFAKTAGMSSKDFSKAFKDDAAGAIITFIEGLGKVQTSGGNVFGVLEDLGLTEIRLRDALLRASGAGDLFRESIDLGTQAWGENIALTNEAELRYGTTASQLSMLWNQLKDVAITVGDVLVPVLMDLLAQAEPLFAFISSAAKQFAGLDKSTQLVIFFVVGLVGAIGPLLVAAGLLATAIAAISWPIVAVVAGIAVLVGAFIYAWNNVEGFRDIVMTAFEAIKNVIMTAIGIVADFLYEKLAAIREFWAENGAQITEAATNVWNGILAVVEFIMPAIQYLIETVWNAIKHLIDGTLNAIMGLLKIFAGLFTGDWNKMWEGVKQFFFGILEALWGYLELTFIGKMLKTVGSFFTSFRNLFSSGVNSIKETFTTQFDNILGYFNGLKSKFFDAGKGLINQMKDGIMNAAKAVLDAVKDVAQSVRNLLPFSPAKDGPLSDLDKLDFGGPITDSIFRGMPEVRAQMAHMLEVPQISASPAIAPMAGVGAGGGSAPVINIYATYVDPEAARRFAAEVNAEMGWAIGGKR